MGQLEGKNKELKKHAAAIHCSNTLTLLQRKISNCLLFHAYHELATELEHQITIKQLCKLIGYAGNNHSVIKEALKGLISTVIEWNVMDERTGEEDWSATSMLASVRLKGPLCSYAYSPRMKELFYSPSIYGKINLMVQSRFKSSYGLALYENCVRYRGLPNTKWFDVSLFRKLMGVPEGQYAIFRDFKRRVIDKAVEEVNTHSDIIIEPDYQKEGRKVSAVKFTLKEREKKTKLGASDTKQDTVKKAMSYEQEVVYERLQQDFNITETMAKSLINDYELYYIQEKMLLTTVSMKNNREIKNIPGFLLSAIKSDYKMPASSVQKIAEQQQSLIEKQEQQRYQEAQQQQMLNAYHDFVREDFCAHFDGLRDEVQQRILQQWQATLVNKPDVERRLIQKYYKEHSFRHPYVFIEFKQFMERHFPQHVKAVISQTEFSQQYSGEVEPV